MKLIPTFNFTIPTPSKVPIGSKASITNLSYGYCKLHDEAKIACPYKNCIWAETALQVQPDMTDDEIDAAAEMWEQANAAAETSAVAAAEAEKAAAETPEEDVNMDTGDDTVPQPAHAVVDR